jgi:hypothetical protein
MKLINFLHVWVSIKKKSFLLFLLWNKVLISYIINRKKIKSSDSYLEYKYILKNGISCFPYSFVHQF